jgi:hypothetical protein
MLDEDTLEVPALKLNPFREDDTTIIEVFRPRRYPPPPRPRGRVPPKAYATTEFALPSVIVQQDPTIETRRIPRARVLTQRMYVRELDTAPLLGPRTSGVLLGALAVAAGIVMLKVIPFLGPLLDAMMR